MFPGDDAFLFPVKFLTILRNELLYKNYLQLIILIERYGLVSGDDEQDHRTPSEE